jgi:hypothetical protein
MLGNPTLLSTLFQTVGNKMYFQFSFRKSIFSCFDMIAILTFYGLFVLKIIRQLDRQVCLNSVCFVILFEQFFTLSDTNYENSGWENRFGRTNFDRGGDKHRHKCQPTLGTYFDIKT